ncbi:MAG: Stk1 family PASTA domain-containing Ser/Thr kinase [Lachnospiraceae bacterium]|nr:Stk1 family PASTA domain-containing Ser/Thr kinase [Lachnospiraceae bacterium]
MIKPGMYIGDDRYEIIEKIGSGGMADVYKAKCHRLNRYVAVKILKQEYSGDKNFITKFRGEAQSAAGLSHPNIVSVYDVGEDNGLHYIVMELVEGITLKKFIEKKGRLAIKEAVGIAIQIAQGLEAAHNNHIIHRDIKPQNIMISREGKVKVADFGIAKAVSANTYTQSAIGSVHYLSPEQARGGYCDEKSDIYSLGVTLYEMLSGTLPFAGDNTVSVALLHIQSEPQPVRELVPAVQYSLDRIVQKCMQKRPENRYLSASELIVDLKRSITNPEGDFVKLPVSGYVPDNPTKMFTDNEVEEIRTTAAKSPVTHYDNRQNNQTPVLKEEEEELDSINSKWEKVIIGGSIVVAGILTLGIVYLAARFFGVMDWFNQTPTTVPSPTVTITQGPTPTPTDIPVGTTKMPNLKGYTFEDAENILHLKSEDFFVVLEDEVYSTEPKGTVINQYPLADSDVLMDATIKLTISAGPEPLRVPRVTGMTEEDATQQLGLKGFQVVPSYEASDEYPSGSVIRTEPGTDETIYEGDTITIVVSTGKNPTYVKVPRLIGKTVEEALEALEAQNLILGDIAEETSDTVAAGKIIRQSVGQDETVLSETAINVTISKGSAVTATPVPEPTAEPTAEPTPEPTDVPVVNPEPTVEPEPTEVPEPTPEPTVEPTPEPTEAPAVNPEPTVEPEPYFPLSLSTTTSTKPVNEGETVFYILEIVQGNWAYTIADGYLSYEDYPEEAFYFKLLAEDYPGLEEGTAEVKLYVSDDLIVVNEWLVTLQEFTE